MGNKDLSGLGSLARTYYAGFFQLIKESGCSGVAEFEVALKKGSRSFTASLDKIDCLGKDHVFFFTIIKDKVGAGSAGTGNRLGENVLVVLRGRLLLEEIN